MPLISVIIPVYNVETYLDECLESVVSQTYKNLEIILVDDGSTDSCGKKCDLWEKKDARIRVLHKKNGGLSDARNAGLEIAAGDYIGFVDSDDVIHPYMYECLYELMIYTECDISCCNVKWSDTFEDFLNSEKEMGQFRTYSPKEALISIVKEADVFVMVWNKLYKKSVLKNIRFEIGKQHEDEFFTYQVIAKAWKIAASQSYYYGYRQRENSIMKQTYSVRNLDLLEARLKRLYFFEDNFPELVSLAKCDLRFECIRAMQFTLLYLDNEEQVFCKNQILDVFHKFALSHEDYRILPLRRQIWCAGTNINFMAICRIRNILHYGP